MTHFCNARGAFHPPLRPKNTIKLPTQSAEKWICMEEWAFEMLAILFSKTRRSQMTGIFYPSGRATELLEYKSLKKKALQESKKKILSRIFLYM